MEAFESLTGFTIGGNPVSSIDATTKLRGAGAIRLEGRGTGTTMTLTKSEGTIDLAADDVLVWATHVEKPTIDAYAANIQIERGGNGTYYGPGAAGGRPAMLYNGNLGTTGFRFEAATVPEFGCALGPAVTNVRARDDFGVTGIGTGLNPVIRHAGLWKTKAFPGTVVLTNDDAMASFLANVAPALDAAGIPMSHYLPWEQVEAGAAGKASKATYQARYAKGDDICLDGHPLDQSVTTYANPDAWLAKMAEGDQWLVNNGWTRGRGHTTFPNADKAILPATKIVAAVTANGTTTLAVTSKSAGTIANGQSVYGYLVPAGTVVVNAADQANPILNNPIPAGTPKVTFIDETGVWAVGQAQAKLAASKFWKSATTGVRGSGQDNVMFTRFGVPQPFDLWRKSHTDLSWAAAQPEYDRVVATGGTLIPLFHGSYAGATGLDTPPEFFTAGMIPWAAPLVAAGKLQFLTLSQWWARDGGATVPA
ncbi:hypothetical protein ASG54_21670 [Aureimonas sp. Leaf460]|nr:hypothetical protein ASG62_16280 [Aureimonas sp. Leaf427]KQT70552.1 hypothetical protein ASG54_21670 [Aureimonas sp. Leaf460]